jgi:hypothetical protein
MQLADPPDKHQLAVARAAPDRLHGLVARLAADY